MSTFSTGRVCIRCPGEELERISGSESVSRSVVSDSLCDPTDGSPRAPLCDPMDGSLQAPLCDPTDGSPRVPLCDPMDCSPQASPGKNTGEDCHSLLQGIFCTWGLNLGLLHCRQILYRLSPQGSHTEWQLLSLPSRKMIQGCRLCRRLCF